MVVLFSLFSLISHLCSFLGKAGKSCVLVAIGNLKALAAEPSDTGDASTDDSAFSLEQTVPTAAQVSPEVAHDTSGSVHDAASGQSVINPALQDTPVDQSDAVPDPSLQNASVAQSDAVPDSQPSMPAQTSTQLVPAGYSNIRMESDVHDDSQAGVDLPDLSLEDLSNVNLSGDVPGGIDLDSAEFQSALADGVSQLLALERGIYPFTFCIRMLVFWCFP